VKRLPEKVTLVQAREILSELTPLLQGDRPCMVFDFSDVQQIDSAGIEMMLRCMEEAIKRNGDLKLAALSPQVMVILQLTRVDRLFEIYANPSDAAESFHRFSIQALHPSPLANAGLSNADSRLSS
jgi:anti-sigma B factor antagonist